MKTVSLNLSVDQLNELHVSLAVRLIDLEKDLNHKNRNIREIVKRQLDRVTPIYQQVEKLVVSHYSNV
jgi:hypothetical protein